MKSLVVVACLVAALVFGATAQAKVHHRYVEATLCHGGYVKWQNGTIQSGVTVVLHDVQTGQNVALRTDGSGIWHFCGSDTDSYTAQASWWTGYECYVLASVKYGPTKLLGINTLTFSLLGWGC